MRNSSTFCADGVGMVSVCGCAECIFFVFITIIISERPALNPFCVSAAAIGNIKPENIKRSFCSMGVIPILSCASSVVMPGHFTRGAMAIVHE